MAKMKTSILHVCMSSLVQKVKLETSPHYDAENSAGKLFEVNLWSSPRCRNVIKLFLEEVSLSMMVGRTVRCTTILDVALCVTAVKNPSLADALQPCIVNFTLSTLCAHSALSNLTKAPSKNRMINLIAIHAS